MIEMSDVELEDYFSERDFAEEIVREEEEFEYWVFYTGAEYPIPYKDIDGNWCV